MMAEIIRKKRKELGMTQEQVAEHLGVTAPAVHKWESGVSCPDVMLLPGLARVLKTDLNTLFEYQQELSEEEIGTFSNLVAETFRGQGIQAAFSMMEDKLREYPSCDLLRYQMAMMLEGTLVMSPMTAEEKRPYQMKLWGWYQQAAESSSDRVRNAATFMLASKYIREKDYAKAQEMIDQLPTHTDVDRKWMQAELWGAQGKYEDAAKLLEGKMLSTGTELQTILMKLVNLEMAVGNREKAAGVANRGQTAAHALDIWDYYGYVLQLQIALAEKNAVDAVALIRAMLNCAITPLDMSTSPLYYRITAKPTKDNWPAMLPPLLTELENGADYAFLRGMPEFEALLTEFRDKLDAAP